MIEILQVEKLPFLPLAPLALLPGGAGSLGSSRPAYITKFLRKYKHGAFFESMGFRTRSLAEAEAYVLRASDKLREDCHLARIYECDNPRLTELTGAIASLGTTAPVTPGLRLVKEFTL